MGPCSEAYAPGNAKAFDVAGPFEEPATPHRFRHTFARIRLQRCVPVADVADLLGDDERRCASTTRAGCRNGRLTKILKDAFGDKPKLTAIPGGRA